MSLCIKLTASLLLVSLITAAAVGGFAYNLLTWDFRQSIKDQAFKNFQQDVTAYISTYDSWEQAARREPFPEFVRRPVPDHQLHLKRYPQTASSRVLAIHPFNSYYSINRVVSSNPLKATLRVSVSLSH